MRHERQIFKPESFFLTAIVIGAVVLIGILAVSEIKTMINGVNLTKLIEVKR